MFGIELASRPRTSTSPARGALLGLDIGTYSIKACRLAPSKQGARLEQVRVTPYTHPLSASDFEGSFQRIGTALHDGRISGSRWRPIPIACTLPACMTQMRLLDAPAESDVDQETLILRELAAEDNDRGEAWLGDYWPIESTSSEEGDSPIGIVGARRDWVERLITCLEQHGLEPRVMDGAPFAIARAMRRDRKDGEFQAALDIGYEGALFVFMWRGLPTYFRVLRGCGMRSVVEAIQNGLSIDERESHQFLKACSQASRRPSASSKTMLTTLRDLAAMPLRRLQNEIARTLDFSRRQGNGGDLKRITLLGGGALLPGITPLLESWTDLEFRIWTLPLDPLSAAHDDSLPLLAQAMALAEIASAE